MKKHLLLLFTAILLSASAISAQTLAFPGAEGYGRYAKGARASANPTIYHVTNLNDSGTGSFRDAISQPNRIIVFDVAGVINIGERLIFQSNLTIAGQTAPGDGIVIYGNGVSFSGNSNIIVRHLRFRMGLKGDSGKDAAGISNGTDMIFDHCSFTWGLDETFSISWDSKGTEPGNITIQNSIIGQGIMVHSAGGLIQTNGGVTLYKNLYADNKTRNPKVKHLNQYVNNVVYNWGSGGGYILGDTEGSSWVDFRNNYFIKGPSTGGTDAFVRANEYFQIYQSDNYLDYSTDGILNGRKAENDDFGPATFVPDLNSFTNCPKAHPAISNLLTAENAYYWIVDSVGSVLPNRDQVDTYIINELKSLGTKGALINGEADLGLTDGVGNVFASNQQKDSDNDGIPDSWEDANGLNKNDASDALTLHANGYLNIERYINSIKSGQSYVRYPTVLAIKSLDTDYVTLKWNNNALASTAIVIEQSTDNTNFSELVRISPSLTEYKIQNLTPGVTYYFRLKTVDGNQESLYTPAVKASTLGVPAPPVASVNPVPADHAIISAYSKTTLQWTNLTGTWAGILYYDVYVGTSADNLQKVASALTTPSFQTDLLPHTTYYWRVDVTNLLGSATGSVWSFTSGNKPEREKLAYFSMNETTGNTATNDIQGYASAQNFTPTWETGKFGNCVTIPSSPSNAALVQSHYDAISLGSESFSIEMWFKSSGGAVDWYLIHKGSHTKNTSTGATGKWFGIQYNKTGSNDRLTWAVDDDVTKTDLNVSGGSQFFNNQWHHLVAIRNIETDQLSMYIDGVFKGSKTDGTGNIAQTENLVIGNTNVNFVNAFGGSIDELSIYKGALTAEEILENYNKGMATGFYSPSGNGKLTVYPNPFTTELNIDIPGGSGSAVSVAVYTLTGQLVKVKTGIAASGKLTLNDLSEIPQGVYLCKLMAGEKEITAKIVKQ